MARLMRLVMASVPLGLPCPVAAHVGRGKGWTSSDGVAELQIGLSLPRGGFEFR
jgi:hypothetical protein